MGAWEAVKSEKITPQLHDTCHYSDGDTREGYLFKTTTGPGDEILETQDTVRD